VSWEQRNADFCKAQTEAQMAYIEAERMVAKLQDENAKLRELVDELWSLAYGYVPHESELDAARDMMRELGVEVDDGY